MPGIGVLRLLTSQQRAVGWKRQPEVEKSLGLEKGAISRYFQQLGQSYRAEWAVDARLQLKMAGVYRVRGLRRGNPLPPKNWWIAFAGKGNPRPTLDLSKETHLFSPERAPGEQGGSPACLAELREEGQGSPSTPVPETSEGRTGESCTAALDQSEGGRGGTSEGFGERIEGVKGTPPKATPDGVTITCMRWASDRYLCSEVVRTHTCLCCLHSIRVWCANKHVAFVYTAETAHVCQGTNRRVHETGEPRQSLCMWSAQCEGFRQAVVCEGMHYDLQFTSVPAFGNRQRLLYYRPEYASGLIRAALRPHDP